MIDPRAARLLAEWYQGIEWWGGGGPPGDPAFWNVSFGAARTFRQIGTVAEAAAFFRDGRARALAAAAATTPIRRTS